ncbi:MAG: FKBP-type peptidyl-prolyl cis-trans isomerase, partial [Desulfovibrionaceae bacterium]|nr:FKBP-type peptidyl-prolyl cis-trans isomerase [Desulfovibrionaceae bacterium]
MPIENGDTVKVHYVGTLRDGTEFDSSRREGREPLEFTVGRGQLIPGFEAGVKGREVGDRFTVEIPCDQAYGP